ncbi:MAG TPA: AMP-binding protein [Isosphaeraceae bacterium]|nr:AMP-binding protein [Isosphaeraceae bacterium]
MFSKLAWNAYINVKGLRRQWRELDRFQLLDPAAARQVMGRHLLEQLHYFAARDDALPEWREAASVRNPEDLWRIWPSLPVLTKRDLQIRFRPQEMRSRFRLEGWVGSTGGSTGEPTRFFHDRAMLQNNVATRAYCRLKLGWRPGMPTVIVWGSERDVGRHSSRRQRLSATFRNDHLVDGYEMTDRTVERVLSLIDRHRPVAMQGFTSLLEFVARQTLRRGDVPPPGSVRTAWNGGEMLFETQSELFSRAFGVPILNLYGGRELSPMAYQTAPGLPLHVLRPFLFVEILDDRGRPVGPGETGRLVWTSTVCRGTPFLRYDIGDLGTYDEHTFDESGVRAIASLQGRYAGLLTLANGKTINNLFWNHLFKDFPEVEHFQVALKGDTDVEIRLTGSGFEGPREGELRRILHGFLGAIPVTIRWTDRIPLTGQGKLVQTVCEPAPARPLRTEP